MFKLVLILLLFVESLFALEINDQTTFNELLPHSEIYIDYNRSENITTIQNKKFKPIHKKILGFGYSPDFDVWIRFTLTNSESHSIQKIIEYSNPLTSNVVFFEDTTLKKEDGLLHRPKDRISINPILEITLKPHESKQFFIKASSKITTLIIKLNLWSIETFYHKEIRHQIILALFFGAMLIAILYNSTVFFATQELSYLYYVLFFITLSFHHLIYKGVANLYLFSSQFMSLLIEYTSFIVALPTIFLALFTQKILRLKQYPRLNKILNYLLILYPIVLIVMQITDIQRYHSLFFITLLVFLFLITCYALIKKNRQARFIIVGWILFVSSGTFMYLSSLGVYNIFEKYPYLTELSLVLEITVFSLALASKIKMLNQEKQISKQRALLLKELNHRFKNSMQTILSFLFFQKEKTEDKKINEILTNLENRIVATTNLYSLLQTQDNTIVVNTDKYFSLIIKNIRESFKQDNVKIDIQSDVNMNSEHIVYCGLIINEAVTNAFKYAFKNRSDGKIEVSLYEQKEKYHLSIKDNGSGFKDKSKNSLGLYIIEILATIQLEGSLNIKKNNGVEIDIIWEKK